MLGCTLLTVGGAIQASSFGLAQLIVGRIVAGLGTGLNTTAIPMWHVESSEGAQRGKAVTMELVLNIFGIVIADFLNYGFAYETNSAVAWRFPIAFQCFFAVVTFIFVVTLPESPRWLILKDRHEEARQVIARYRAVPATSPIVHSEVNIIADSVFHELEDQRKSWTEMFHNGREQNFRRILLGAGTAFMQQLCGCNIVATYLPIALTRSVGLSPKLALILAACNSISLMCWGAVSMTLIDSWGRVKLLLLSAAGLGCSLFGVAIALRYPSHASGIIATTFIFIYNVFFGLGLLSIPWLYPAEINSQSMRNAGTSISTSVNWLFVYLVVVVTPLGIDNLGWSFYLMFGFFNIAFLPFIWYFYVETAGLSLEQVDNVFELKHDSGPAMSYKQAREQVLAMGPLGERDEKDQRATVMETE